MSQNKSVIGTVIKLVIIVVVIVAAGKFIMDFFKVTDLTNMLYMDKEQLATELDAEFTSNPNMVNRIYQYSSGTVTVESDNDKGIALIYIDGKKTGVHVDNSKYSLYGISKGEATVNVESNMTFEYDESFHVIEDLYQGHSTAIWYCNNKTGECLVVISNDVSSKVVAITYYNNMKKVTEQLSGI